MQTPCRAKPMTTDVITIHRECRIQQQSRCQTDIRKNDLVIYCAVTFWGEFAGDRERIINGSVNAPPCLSQDALKAASDTHLQRSFMGRSTIGYRVIATARRVESMAGLAEMNIETLALDVSNDSSVRSVRNKVAGGKLNVLVNNAGQAYTVPAVDDDIERARALFDVNVFGTMRMVKVFVDMLIASGDARIIQIGSIVGGISPIPFNSVYNASKAATHAYGDTLRVELAPFGIKVITIITGFVKTKLGRYGGLDKDSLYQPMATQFNAFPERIAEYEPMEADVYAKEAVRKAMGQNPSAWIWSGTQSLYTWLVHTFAWKTAFDSGLSRYFGLEAFAAKLRSKEDPGKVAFPITHTRDRE